jgi:DNA-binding response OmpR family regulator
MARLSFDGAETLIYDPVAGNRAGTRAALFNLGFRRIETVATLDALGECIMRRPPDLALCEAQGAEAGLCAMIQSLRQGMSGYNPFVVIIVTAWENNNSLVSRVINSGADDLLLRPFSAGVLGARIRLHVERRKGFIITSDYVGPDRRRGPMRNWDGELFEPPNSLKMKVLERLTDEAANQRLDAQLKQARATLNSEKLKRDAFQICVLWRLMQEDAPRTGEYDVDLTHLKDVTKGVARRSLDTQFEDAGEWCSSVLAAIDGLEAGADRSASMHLLGHAALNLDHLFSPDKAANDRLAEIDATVAIVKARTQTAMAS